ncbi:hypothetical protein TVAG_380370 [Trichomonas vaginalis G3]|uniref:Uncharacterized protein n=1 Tax=Trichomonas vaginalis (strain ATCC PRA-98 / G3) TaxID=412133 RepID=A2DXH5_TRIV3|nr:hypothetical protein TVAGG3_0925090 [Trichomonas vaginalis G3]EAY14927.1 hypothetical protein TVAG_380370 [Trichomonas vaginalis G3]KAI5485407.1 hypothetical protein TVAGG3_0925090 [Trichomonas vaginalis G3]|eukprot:XP_001327150.1 hypothetical protein [Trichomonas vaginalis G3]
MHAENQGKKAMKKPAKAQSRTVDTREKQIISYIRLNYEQMIYENQILKERPENFVVQDAVNSMVQTFIDNMGGERESYLRELIRKLATTYQECVDLQKKYQEAKKGAGNSAEIITKQNEDLKIEIESLTSKLQELEVQKQSKEQSLKSKVSSKQNQLKALNDSITNLQNAHRELSNQVEDLKSTVLKNTGRQKKLIQQAKSVCISEIEKTIDNNQQAAINIHDKKMQRLDAQLSSARAEQKRLQRQAQTVLDAIYSISSPSTKSKITVDDFLKRYEEVKQIIQTSIEAKKEEALAGIRKDIEEAIPGIDVSSGNIIDAINRKLEERLREKEEECRRIVKKGEEREKLLKMKLEEVLGQIKELRSGTSENLDFFDDVERQRSLWEKSKDKLDAKMSAIGLGIHD